MEEANALSKGEDTVNKDKSEGEEDQKMLEKQAKRLGTLLQVPCEGFETYMKGDVSVKVEGHTKTEIVTFLGGKSGVSVMNHNDLSPFHKLLFNLVKKSLIWRTQNKNEFCYLYMALIFCMSKKIKINFPSLMMQHLKHCIEKEIKIGYGATLATMFEDLGVKLVDFYGIMKEKRENIINGDTLRGLSLEVMKGRCEKYEAKKDKAKKESPQPTESVGKSRRLTTGTQVKTRLSEPLEISDKDEGTEELVSELANRVMQVEGQLMEMTGKVRSLERTIQNQEKEFQKKLSTMEAKMLKMKEDNKTTLEQILKTLDD
ncbi:uncharacterized protein LOC110690425 isoform X2 [Chenopodium quinoa]|uniref:uncharacterized protein LOC110690425 isoform X2 n=1 Tax=Chenopodium quinoa TaxID=63459 RepID=UPI000B775BF5|nr:uncharacterized protein LOC110690425 isoform X2 [Chenopodium quinoa]